MVRAGHSVSCARSAPLADTTVAGLIFTVCNSLGVATGTCAHSACGQGGGGPMPAIDARAASARHELATGIRCDGCFVVRGGGTLLPCRECLHLARSINERLNPSRTQRTDQETTPYIWLSIVGSGARGNALATEYPRLDWQVCIPSNAAAYADELRMGASQPCPFVGSFSGTKLALLEC